MEMNRQALNPPWIQRFKGGQAMRAMIFSVRITTR
jgi:hypothetical protein